MIIHDYECQVCGEVTEHFIQNSANIPTEILCPICNGRADKVVSISQTSPVDASWIAGVREVVDKKSNKPHIKEFLRHPTRANLNTFLKKENLRHMDPAEPAFPKVDRAARKKRETREMLKMHMERNRIEVSTA